MKKNLEKPIRVPPVIFRTGGECGSAAQIEKRA